MKLGIIGLPNVGKSSLFNVLTHANVPAENFPFTTIEPNVGIINVPDPRLDTLKQMFQPDKTTSAVIEFVDIAGLVKGASKGEGLGNKFLAHIREVDALAQVLRGFATESVVNVLGKVSPVEEIAVVDTELVLSDLELIDRRREKIHGLAKAGNAQAREEQEGLEKVREWLAAGNTARTATEELLPLMQPHNLLTLKPVFYILNVEDNDTAKKLEVEIKQKYPGANVIVAVNVKLELELAELDPAEQESFRAELGVDKTSGIDRVVTAGKELLKLVTFFTVVGTEIRAWLIPVGTQAVDAAGKIHTDMAKGFIRAEVYAYSQLMSEGSEKSLREKGMIRAEGKTYIVKEGDVIKILFN
ncbi:MAG: redox-regulated ATPase YchF [Elusimicrobiota bacterium]